MKDKIEKKNELEAILKNSIWENPLFGLSYKFQNESDLWINGNAHFNYKIDIENDRLVLKFFPNGQDFFIELKYGEIIYLQDDKQQFELSLSRKL
jgi:hypothetical protein